VFNAIFDKVARNEFMNRDIGYDGIIIQVSVNEKYLVNVELDTTIELRY
jgi:hypothetical protein